MDMDGIDLVSIRKRKQALSFRPRVAVMWDKRATLILAPGLPPSPKVP